MYPSISEYIQAIELSADTFKTLHHLTPLRRPDGQLYFSSGNFAVVFRMQDCRTGHVVAVRCFLRAEPQRQTRLWFIARYIADYFPHYLIPFTYHTNELWVDTRFGQAGEFDLVTMPWIDGQPLARYVADLCQAQHKDALHQLARRFDKLAHWLINQPFAHGDLKPDNILVGPDGLLTLIDYDGFYVPMLDGLTATELGTLPYRHPARTLHHFDRHLDDFSLLALSLELHALSINPALFTDTDSLFLSTQTVEQPFSSSHWEQLRSLQSRAVSLRAGLLEYALHSDPGAILALKKLLVSRDY